MKITDKTPYRDENGQIDLIGRARGTLKYGLTWYSRIQSQESIIAVFEKFLDSRYVLLRNIILPGTSIDLPLVLVGPGGIYLINATHERGVYQARDEEWGTVSGTIFVPARINQLQRTVKLGRVLQLYLSRSGYKDTLVVDAVLMATDPGMHVESLRPAARIVLSDALERFAISINQARPIFTSRTVLEISRIILLGPPQQKSTAESAEADDSGLFAGLDNSPINLQETLIASVSPFESLTPSMPGFSNNQAGEESARKNHETPEPTGNSSSRQDDTIISSPFSGQQITDGLPGNSDSQDDFFDNLRSTVSLDFDAPINNDNSTLTLPEPNLGLDRIEGSLDTIESSENDKNSNSTIKPTSKNSGFLGMSRKQVWILAGLFLFWLVSMIAFMIYVYLNL